MTRSFTTVALFCLTALLTAQAHANDNIEVAKCFQNVARAEKQVSKAHDREIVFYNLAEKHGIISEENTVDAEKKPAYFKFMQVYSENLVAPAELFCKAMVEAANSQS